MCREVLLRATEVVAAELGVYVVLLEVIRKTTFFENRETPKNMPLLYHGRFGIPEEEKGGGGAGGSNYRRVSPRDAVMGHSLR